MSSKSCLFSFGYISISEILDHMIVLVLNFLKRRHGVLHSDGQFALLPTVHKGPVFPTASPRLVILKSLWKERSAVNFMRAPLYITSCFSFTPFKVLSLSSTFDILIKLCLGMGLFGVFFFWNSLCLLLLDAYFFPLVINVFSHCCFQISFLSLYLSHLFLGSWWCTHWPILWCTLKFLSNLHSFSFCLVVFFFFFCTSNWMNSAALSSDLLIHPYTWSTPLSVPW